MLALIILISAFSVLWWFRFSARHPPDFPPGPRFPLPLIGDALSIKKSLPEGFQDLRRTYGEIFGLYVGNSRSVVVSDPSLIQEVGSNPSFIHRQELPIEELRGGRVKSGDGFCTGGLAASSGPTWAEQRRFALHTLRDLGFGKKSMEAVIADDVSKLLSFWQEGQGDAVDPAEGLSRFLINSVWSIVSHDERHQRSERKMQELVNLIKVFFQDAVKPLNAIFFLYKPLWWLAEKTNIVSGPRTLKEMSEFAEREVAFHEATFNEDNLRDFTDHYLKKMKDASNSSEESSFKGNDGKVNLVNTLFDMFIGGGETTATTLNWAVYYLTANPEVQIRVQYELDTVTERKRLPDLSDRDSTPYTDAVILEVQRCGSIFPLSVTHAAGKDAYLGPYFIPKGTHIYQNIWALHMDPSVFPEPDKFDPTRYLSKTGRFEPHPMVLPFGIGRRRCLGEGVARMSLYLYLTGILSTFTLVREDARRELPPPSDRVYGITATPAPYKIRFIKRKQ